MVRSKPSLYRDQRGGVEMVLYLILIAGVAMVALAGVRYFTTAAEDSFEGSTRRFDRPGTYVGGEIQPASGRDRAWTGDTNLVTPRRYRSGR